MRKGQVIEFSGKEKEYEYFGIFNEYGYRCGYVRVPELHSYYKKNYGDININCHGGLTFSDFIDPKEIKLLNDTLFIPREGWYIGFDCAHCNDAFDFEKSEKIFKSKIDDSLKYLRIRGCGSEIRTLEYVKENCFEIISQLEKHF